MPMTVAYTNFGAQLIHENRGGTESFFTADPLGSVVDVRNSSGTQTFSATYWPYGEIRTSTGTNPSQFDFVGSLGYYRENSARTYVRARFLRKELARWMTADPLWPEELAYIYAELNPATYTDSPGLKVSPKNHGTQCYVRECSLYDDKPKWGILPAHSWVCGQSPQRKCSGGLPGNVGYEQKYGCKTGWINNGGDVDWVACRDISTDCGIAALACKCITKILRGPGGVPEYIFPVQTCYDFDTLVMKCICDQFPDLQTRSNCHGHRQRFNDLVGFDY